MTWFKDLMGFDETQYAPTQAQLQLMGTELVSKVNGRRYGIGRLETPTLNELRAQAAALRQPCAGRLQVFNTVADAYALHGHTELKGTLVQVASQFNLLEMTHPSVSPEDGVSRYAADLTQGPACAMAAGAATIYRNYLAPVGEHIGQTRTHQINTLSDLCQALPSGAAIRMQNGYALLGDKTLSTVDAALAHATEPQLDAWRGLLRIGLHWDVETTAPGPGQGQLLSQAFCSALPVSYNSNARSPHWARLATLVLEAAYEATLCAAIVNQARGQSNRVYLTLLGGGAFGNQSAWIEAALGRALDSVADLDLQVHLVSYRDVPASLQALARRY